MLENYNDLNLKMKKIESKKEIKKIIKVKKNFKSIQKIVFNQDKSLFALIWKNVIKEVEVEESKNDFDNIPLQ